jgi:hypothetical protein
MGMKAIILTVLWLSGAMLSNAAEEFDYKTVSYSMSLLKKWEPENPWELATRYTGEFGDGGGTLQLIGYPTSNDSKASIRYSALLIGPYSVATKPKIRVFEDLKVSDAAIHTKGLTIQFFQFKLPGTQKIINGALIEGLFYEAPRG